MAFANDPQYQQALALALAANKSRKRRFIRRSSTSDSAGRPSLEGFGHSPALLRRSMISRASLRKKLRSIVPLRTSNNETLRKTGVRRLRSRHVGKSMGITSPDQLDPLRSRRLNLRQRTVAFLELFDPDAVGCVDQLLAHGGTTEVELWNALQAKYGVNRAHRLASALRQGNCYCADVEALLRRNKGREEELIAHYMRQAGRHAIDHEWKRQTWKSGNNTYQQLPAEEQND